jgi:hypothetical protein
MSYEIIGSHLFKNYSVSIVAALNAAALNDYLDISPNVLEASGKRPSARTPDRPSSTR